MCKTRGIFYLSVELVISQKGLFFMQFTSFIIHGNTETPKVSTISVSSPVNKLCLLISLPYQEPESKEMMQ